MGKANQQTTGRKTRLGEFVRDYRLKHNLKQRKLEEELGSRRGYVSKIETGLIGTPDLEFLKALSKKTKKSVSELLDFSRTHEESKEAEQVLPRKLSVPAQEFKLVFGHSLWGAPIFHAAHQGQIPEFAVASFARFDPASSPRVLDPVWFTSQQLPPSPGPEVNDLAALSAADVLAILRREEADLGAVPGNLVPEDFIRIASIVDSAAGCMLICTKGFLSEYISEQSSGRSKEKQSAQEKLGALETRELALILESKASAAKTSGKKLRIGVEENTIAHEFLKHICEQSRAQPKLQVNDVKWVLRSSELATKSFKEVVQECNSDGVSDLVGVVVWEPLGTWMTMNGKGADFDRVPIHFAPNELGKPHHLSYELVIRQKRIGRMNPKEKELCGAIAKLVYELWDSSTQLNRLSKSSADFGTIEQLARYYRFTTQPENIDEETIRRTLEAVGGIRYSVRWDVRGLSALF